MSLKFSIGKKIPLPILNNLFLRFPFLYKTKFVNYESCMDNDSLNELIEGIVKTQELKGEIIECGCSRCGTTCILGNYLKKNKINKKIFALDSFVGFEPNELKKEREINHTVATTKSFTYTSLEYVLKKIKKLKLIEQITPIKGFFEYTLPKIKTNFCFGLVDCDLEKSIEFSSEMIWKKLTPGGMLFFDDYHNNEYKGAMIAIDKFVSSHKNEIKEQGDTGRLYHVTKNI